MVGGAGATVDGGAVTLVKTADTDVLTEVDVTGDGGGTLVEPASGVLGRKLLTRRSLHDLNEAGDLEGTLTLKERRVGVDKLLSGNVLNGDTSHFFYVVRGKKGRE